MNKNGSIGLMMDPGDISRPICEVSKVPTACVAFRNDGLRFDEHFIGSGFEDDDFCKQHKAKNPFAKFVIANNVKLIHENEMKNQSGKFWEHNKIVFEKKWGKHV